jgi:hypothetical protein
MSLPYDSSHGCERAVVAMVAVAWRRSQHFSRVSVAVCHQYVAFDVRRKCIGCFVFSDYIQ